MSSKVVRLANGRVVRLNGKRYTIVPQIWHISGDLAVFTLYLENNSEIEYIYIYDDDLYKVDQTKDKSRSGYYTKNSFEEYRNSKRSDSYNILEKSKFKELDFDSYEVGDLFEIEFLEYISPYTAFYRQLKYTFRVQDIYTRFSNPVYYPQTIDTDPNSPTYNIKTDTSENLLDKPSGKFYTKNFGEQVHNITGDKEKLSELITRICFVINTIRQNGILDKIAINDLDLIKDPDTWPHLPEVDLFIGYLLRDWGEISSLQPLLVLEDPTIGAFQAYLNSVRNLHKFFRERDENILFPTDSQGIPIDKRGNQLTPEQDSERRLAYIVEVLPPSSIALLPYEYKISYLKRLMEGSITEEDEGIVLAILHSFVQTTVQPDREAFMNFLLESTNNEDTNFDILFHKMDDKTLAYIAPTISLLFDPEESNRGNFCLAIYKIWEKSRFNFYYIPTGSQPNDDGMNPDAYFLNEGIGYYQTENVQTVFDFDAETTNSWPSYQGHSGLGLREKIKERFSTHKQLEKEKIQFEKQVFYNYKYLDSFGNPFGNPGEDRVETYHFRLHIFQPISVIGYKANIDSEVALPEEPYFPAFLFYYHQEFDRLRKNYAKVSFAIDIAVEASLFFLTGGIGTLRHLRHLKYVTHMGKAFRGELAAQEVVYMWKGLNNTSEVFSVTAAMCMSYMNYLSDTAENTPERELANKAGNVFMLLTFLGVGTSFVTKYKAVNAAKSAQQMNNYLLLPVDVRQIIDNLAGNFAQVVTEFRTQKLVSRPNILAKFDNPLWTQEIREAFYADFHKLSDTDLDRLNNAAVSIDNWKALYDRNITDRSVVNFILSQPRTDAIIRYYDVPEIKEVLQLLEDNSRWKFLDDFGTQPTEWLNFLKDNPNAINRWNNLDGAGKIFAKQKPDKWLYVFDRLYINYSYGQKLSNSTILNLFGQRGVNLVDNVEVQALIEYTQATSNKLRKKKVLTSGANCQITGQTIIKTNWSDEALRTIQSNGKSTYRNYMDAMFPNLKTKVEDIIAFNRQNYNVTTGYDVRRTGNFPGAHAEIQAIDELAKIRFDINNPPSAAVFDNWLRNDVLAYNRNIMATENANNVIMHTCADCFHILDLVTFINDFN